ncbi:hypothetical protein [Amycolatopsis samaneae]|uniref:Uncharacterized protein n=1 Tax=Amycolatopsis samaneae TaxID=664691 RepID=A0ABW5GJS0_9PSEU
MGAEPSRSGRGREAQAWRIVDRWVRDPLIRRDGLIALAMVLAALVLLAACLSGGAAAVLPALVVKVLGGATAALVAGWGAVRAVRSRRARRAVPLPRGKTRPPAVQGRNDDRAAPGCPAPPWKVHKGRCQPFGGVSFTTVTVISPRGVR